MGHTEEGKMINVLRKSIFLIAVACFFSGCSNKALDEAKVAVDSYNTEVESYNEKIVPYNAAIDEISAKNQELESVVDEAQNVINKGEQPYNEDTLSSLKEAMGNALDAKVKVPEKLSDYQKIEVDEKGKKDDLETIKEDALEKTEELKGFSLPESPAVPDYNEVISEVNTAKQEYEDSIQSMKQITAPADEFVMERLQKVDTITAMDAVTEDHDLNGMLNKQGGYIGCIYFADSQVDRSKLYIEEGKDNVIDVGCKGGGAIEIFNTIEEAQTRDKYLGSFDGTGISSGSHYVYGTVIVRTSDELSGSQQKELTQKIVDALTYVEH